jgi:hypothetical protein
MNYDTSNMIEVLLNDPDDFLKVKETLTRIGIASKKENTLFQSCHILHKRGKYYLVHFKELFALDGKETDFTVSDIQRRNTIIKLLVEWNLITLKEPKEYQKILENLAPLNLVKIIPHKEKHNWKLVAKYSIGKKKKSVPVIEDYDENMLSN